MMEEKTKQDGGEKATFWVQIQTQRNRTWQGKVTWTDNGRVQYFRSALELIKLLDSAVRGESDLFENASERESTPKEK